MLSRNKLCRLHINIRFFKLSKEIYHNYFVNGLKVLTKQNKKYNERRCIHTFRQTTNQKLMSKKHGL